MRFKERSHAHAIKYSIHMKGFIFANLEILKFY